MAEYWEDWSDYSIGDDPTVSGPAGWSRQWHADETVSIVDISSDSPPTGYSRALRIDNSVTDRRFYSFDAVDSDADRATVKVAALIRCDGDSGGLATFGGVAARGSGGTTSETGIPSTLTIETGIRKIAFIEYDGGSGTLVTPSSSSDMWNADQWYWMVGEYDGTTVTVTIYPENDPGGTPVESFSDTVSNVTAAGWVGLFQFAQDTGGVLDVAAFNVATGTSELSFTETADETAPTLTNPTGTETGDTTADLSVDTDEGNGTLYWVVTTSFTTPSVAQIQVGENDSGSTASASGDQSVSSSGTQNVSTSGLSAETTYYAHYQHQDAAGNDSSVVTSSSFTTEPSDTTAPVLSSPSGTATGSTTADLSVSTDEGDGTLYWVVTTSSTSPSIAQVQAGNDDTGSAADDSGNQSVSSTGTQNASATGLVADTAYYVHFQHEDSSGNNSSVSSSASFTTDEAPTETVALPDDFDSAIGTATVTDGTTSTPVVTINPDDQPDRTRWLTVYVRISGVDGKTPQFHIDLSNFVRFGPPISSVWEMVWRYVDDVTVPSDGRPREWTRFDSGSENGDYSFSNNSAFTSNVVEISIKPRWRYLDTQRAFDYVDGTSYSVELSSSSSASGLPKNVHYQIDHTGTPQNSAAPTTLNMYCIGVDDTGVQPDGGEDKFNVVILAAQHASEDQGNLIGWEQVYLYTDGTGTVADWFRKHCRLFVYDPNPAGRYYGKERWTEESGGDEDPNRSWDDSNSEQVNAVKDALTADMGRMDIMLDEHGDFRLYENGINDEFGVYLGNGGADFLTRINNVFTNVSVADLGEGPTGTAQNYADTTWNAQLSLTPEFPIAAPNFPGMNAMYGYVAEAYAEAIQQMEANDELTLVSGVSFSGTVPTLNATQDQSFSEDLSGYFSGTDTPFTYSLQSGTLPSGLSLDSSTGVISGTPTSDGTTSGLVVRATDQSSNTADTNSFSIDIAPAATPVSFSGTVPTLDGVESISFSVDLSGYFSGSATPFTYSVQSGTLPPGLSLDSSTGVISGTPTSEGTASGLVIRATDQNSDTADTNSFSIDITASGDIGMATVLDRVFETSSSTGTGTIVLDGAVDGFTTFSGAGSEVYYAIYFPTTGEWEVGLGTYTENPRQITRDTVMSSTNGGAAVNLGAGTKDVFSTAPGSKLTEVLERKVQTDPLDTTSDALMTVRAFGLGGAPVGLTDSEYDATHINGFFDADSSATGVSGMGTVNHNILQWGSGSNRRSQLIAPGSGDASLALVLKQYNNSGGVVGTVSIAFVDGDYSGLRARSTTQDDVGLSNVRNVQQYSQSEVDSALSGKADTDGNYASLRAQATTKGDVGLGSVNNVSQYSQSQVDNLLSDKADTGGDYNGLRARSTTKSDVGLSNVRNAQQYSQGEVDNLLSGKADTGSSNTFSGTQYFSNAIHVNGSVVAFSTSVGSDKRFKSDIRSIRDREVDEAVDGLVGRVFYHLKLGHWDSGFIAQEVLNIPALKHLVVIKKGLFGLKRLYLNYTGLIPYAFKAISRNKAKIDKLEKRIAELEEKLSERGDD